MEILLLNKEKVDLPDKPITRKIQIGDIGDIAARKSTKSYSLTIPRTSNNMRILDMLGVDGNTSRKPFELVVADYIVDGIPLVINGYAVINQTSGGYDLNIIDGIIDLGEKLKGKKLADLALDDLTHTLTTQGYIDSMENTEGYIYGIADYGLELVSSSVKVEKQAPSIFVHTLFRRIFEEAGLSLQGDFFLNNTDYLTEVLAPSRGYTIDDSSLSETPKGSVESNIIAYVDSRPYFLEYTEKHTLTGIGLVGASIDNNDILFSTAGRYRLQTTISSVSEKTILNLRIEIVGKKIINISLPFDQAAVTDKDLVFIFDVGDRVRFTIEATSELVPDETGLYRIDFSNEVDVNLVLQEGGTVVQAQDYIADINQIDFVKDVINRYGLVLHPITDSINYRFEKIENILNDREGAEDWTKKLGAINLEKYQSGYAKRNFFKYKYPDEIVVPNNDGFFDIDNINTESEKTILNSIYTIPRLISILVNSYYFPVRSIEDGEVINEEIPPSIMKVVRVGTTIEASLFDETGTISKTGNIPFLRLDNMSMQYFLDTYYAAFIRLINDYKEVEMELNLSLTDIYNLDFFKLKYFRQTGRYYYLDSVEHKPNRLAKVKLIEISNFV